MFRLVIPSEKTLGKDLTNSKNGYMIKIMALQIKQFLDEIQTPIKKLTVSQLREREELWRALWSWTDEEVKRFVLMVGQQVRLMRRDYKGSIGELGQVKFEVKQLELNVIEKHYNYNDGKTYFEQKTILIPWSVVAWVEQIITSEVVDEEKPYEVEELPVEELVK